MKGNINYNEILEEVLSKTPCSQCDGSGAYPDYDGAPVQCQFCWQLRFTFIDKTKQSFTSLIKELVAEAKPGRAGTQIWRENPDDAWDMAIDEFEQNLLKELEDK